MFNILGAVGTGKSYLIKQLQKKLQNQNKNYITLAPTSKAALIIIGMKIHKFVSEMKSTKIINKLKYYYIFVGEISMVK